MRQHFFFFFFLPSSKDIGFVMILRTSLSEWPESIVSRQWGHCGTSSGGSARLSRSPRNLPGPYRSPCNQPPDSWYQSREYRVRLADLARPRYLSPVLSPYANRKPLGRRTLRVSITKKLPCLSCRCYYSQFNNFFYKFHDEFRWNWTIGEKIIR